MVVKNVDSHTYALKISAKFAPMQYKSINHFNSRTKALESALVEVKNQIAFNVTMRVISWVAIFGLFFLAKGVHIGLAIVLSIVSLAVFLFLVRRSAQLSREKKFVKARLFYLEQQIKVLTGEMPEVDSGEEFSDPDHDFSHDLDLFGKSSLFQFVNRTTLGHGGKALSDAFSSNETSIALIEENQTAVAELAQKVVWCEELYGHGSLVDEDKKQVEQLIAWSKSGPSMVVGTKLKALLYIVPIYQLLLCTANATDLISSGLFIPLLLAPLAIIGSKLKKINTDYSQLGKQHAALASYASMLDHIGADTFESSKLKSLQEPCDGAAKAFRQLSKIMSAFDNRNNMLMGVVLNMFLLWDILCIFRLQKWYNEHGGVIELWLETIGQWERTSSLALYSFTFAESLNTPTFEKDCSVKAVDMGHPLMLTKARVDNSMELGIHDFAIITGANMAGKSTFLRTLGVNMVMAMAGAPVLAKSLKMQPRALYSSMRTSDSLQSDESYFYNELKRLHLLIISLEKNNSRFIILDEILKGTNSKDKAEGSFRFIEKLLGFNVNGVVATHDLSLCEIQSKHPSRINNLYFDVEITNDDLSFDYTLRKGVCSNMNATFLMEKMGIV
ncbi:MAG: hypothetical protein ACI84C_000140 [Flavobacteriales bacterium]|jgi:hypothetical protein